ncbi:uncharacterized protein BXZ73DRAFT_87989 [Epithele typhae]|uniref:uncharacterized protein n=1 Tax=Epithele typhae TaxID=378194 RepID=UPI0020080409|nr:uncharacterized protein BXZ73DRAFT_87989 [Epithele typhae]KAH9942397.1 hypothetical protein BXZ73DRAFT_87989 [Epithele typhae]
MSTVKVNTNIKATAVIIGGTGLIGIWISKAFLTDFRSAFPTVRITTRDVNSPKARELAALGAELYSFDDSLDAVLNGADVVVNTLPTHIPATDGKKIITAVAASAAKVYFMSEFGGDYALNDFPGYEHAEWQVKREIAKDTHAAMPDKKVIALIAGLFLGACFNSPYAPLMGLDVKGNAYRSLGPATTRFTASAEIDVGRAVARLAVLALDPATAARVPGTVRLAPNTTSLAELADAAARVRGVPRGAVEEEDLGAFKQALSERPADYNLGDYLRVLLGEGKLDFSANNDNELINPGQSLWKWKTVEDEIREVA